MGEGNQKGNRMQKYIRNKLQIIEKMEKQRKTIFKRNQEVRVSQWEYCRIEIEQK